MQSSTDNEKQNESKQASQKSNSTEISTQNNSLINDTNGNVTLNGTICSGVNHITNVNVGIIFQLNKNV